MSVKITSKTLKCQGFFLSGKSIKMWKRRLSGSGSGRPADGHSAVTGDMHSDAVYKDMIKIRRAA